MPFRPAVHFQETYSPDEQEILLKYFTNCDKPVFAIYNLPEVVKGALFARYSRTHKPLRRLFLDEFLNYSWKASITDENYLHYSQAPLPLWDSVPDYHTAASDSETRAAAQHAQDLYDRIFIGYGDDSVAQLGAAHIACEQVSNIVVKALEWGRLAAYLEQSTRYLRFDRKTEGRYRYVVPPEVMEKGLEADYRSVLDTVFDAYSETYQSCQKHFEDTLSKPAGVPNAVWSASLRSKAGDAARGMLPAATMTNVGIFANGQALEMALVRLQAHPLKEARSYAAMMLEELRKVVPSFLKRVDSPGRGLVWSEYLESIRVEMQKEARSTSHHNGDGDASEPEVALIDWDRDAETKVAATCLYAFSDLPESRLLEYVGNMPQRDKHHLIRLYCGNRSNRRHKPGRAFERVLYKFDILSDFGSFRDLQRHRMLSLEWQTLTPLHGHIPPPKEVEEVGKADLWREVMDMTASLWERVEDKCGREVAQYTVPFGYRMRYYLHMNAREAFHILELRTTPEGHSDYRRICLEMHRLIKEQAGHVAIAEAMTFIDHSSDRDLPRVQSEKHARAKRLKQLKSSK